jgi:predicted NUDIX family NTP pyrophosphohydrolase
MSKVTSAGIVLYRITKGELQVLLGHHGGPFYVRKDKSAWTIPKGEFDADVEDPLQAALREFSEETGAPAPQQPFLDLGTATYSSGKTVFAWAAKGDMDPQNIVSNTFEMEWPKGSGTMQEFPELDKIGWFTRRTAGGKLVAAQLPFIDRLTTMLAEQGELTPPDPEPIQQSLF